MVVVNSMACPTPLYPRKLLLLLFVLASTNSNILCVRRAVPLLANM